MEGKRILVVDDEPQITRVLRRSLAAHRYDVRVAADGESALDTLRDFNPDLIITDLSMPEMSGIEVAQALRAGEDTADVRIVLHTAVDKRWVEERFSDYDLFVTKADDTDRLVEQVAELLSAPRVPRGSEPAEPVYSREEVLRAQQALRSAIGLGPESFPEHTVVGLLDGEIEQLRKIGKTAAEIEALISDAIGRPLSLAAAAPG